MKTKQEIINNIRNRINNNVNEVVDEINEILNVSEFSSLTDFWKDNLQDKYASYTFFSGELKRYNYIYSKTEKKFIEIPISEINKRNSDYSNIINNSLTNETYNYVSKTISVDENIYNQFDVIAKQSYLSKSYLLTLMFKNFVEEFQKNKRTLIVLFIFQCFHLLQFL